MFLTNIYSIDYVKFKFELHNSRVFVNHKLYIHLHVFTKETPSFIFIIKN